MGDDASETDRLARTADSAFERRLLRSARRDAVSLRSRHHILSRLGMGGIWSLAALAAAAKAAAAQASYATAIAGGAVFVGAAALWVGSSVAATPAPSAPKEATTLRSAPEERARDRARAPESPAPRGIAALAEEPPTATPAAKSGVRAPDALSLELDAVEQAREAFARGNYAEALDLLDAYRRRFTHRRLDTEAMVLRIETLSAAGERASAERLGRRFLDKHADGPYARRVRSLVGERGEP